MNLKKIKKFASHHDLVNNNIFLFIYEVLCYRLPRLHLIMITLTMMIVHNDNNAIIDTSLSCVTTSTGKLNLLFTLNLAYYSFFTLHTDCLLQIFLWLSGLLCLSTRTLFMYRIATPHSFALMGFRLDEISFSLLDMICEMYLFM